MANTVKLKNSGAQITIRPTPEDAKIVGLLHRKLGVDTSQIFRLAIRALAAKEGVNA
jgi:hypothetical protein